MGPPQGPDEKGRGDGDQNPKETIVYDYAHTSGPVLVSGPGDPSFLEQNNIETNQNNSTPEPEPVGAGGGIRNIPNQASGSGVVANISGQRSMFVQSLNRSSSPSQRQAENRSREYFNSHEEENSSRSRKQDEETHRTQRSRSREDGNRFVRSSERPRTRHSPSREGRNSSKLGRSNDTRGRASPRTTFENSWDHKRDRYSSRDVRSPATRSRSRGSTPDHNPRSKHESQKSPDDRPSRSQRRLNEHDTERSRLRDSTHLYQERIPHYSSAGTIGRGTSNRSKHRDNENRSRDEGVRHFNGRGRGYQPCRFRSKSNSTTTLNNPHEVADRIKSTMNNSEMVVLGEGSQNTSGRGESEHTLNSSSGPRVQSMRSTEPSPNPITGLPYTNPMDPRWRKYHLEVSVDSATGIICTGQRTTRDPGSGSDNTYTSTTPVTTSAPGTLVASTGSEVSNKLNNEPERFVVPLPDAPLTSRLDILQEDGVLLETGSSSNSNREPVPPPTDDAVNLCRGHLKEYMGRKSPTEKLSEGTLDMRRRLELDEIQHTYGQNEAVSTSDRQSLTSTPTPLLSPISSCSSVGSPLRSNRKKKLNHKLKVSRSTLLPMVTLMPCSNGDQSSSLPQTNGKRKLDTDKENLKRPRTVEHVNVRFISNAMATPSSSSTNMEVDNMSSTHNIGSNLNRDDESTLHSVTPGAQSDASSLTPNVLHSENLPGAQIINPEATSSASVDSIVPNTSTALNSSLSSLAQGEWSFVPAINMTQEEDGIDIPIIIRTTSFGVVEYSPDSTTATSSSPPVSTVVERPVSHSQGLSVPKSASLSGLPRPVPGADQPSVVPSISVQREEESILPPCGRPVADRETTALIPYCRVTSTEETPDQDDEAEPLIRMRSDIFEVEEGEDGEDMEPTETSAEAQGLQQRETENQRRTDEESKRKEKERLAVEKQKIEAREATQREQREKGQKVEDFLQLKEVKRKEALELARQQDEEKKRKKAQVAAKRREDEKRKKSQKLEKEKREEEAQEAVRRKEEEERKKEAQEAVRRKEEEERKKEAQEAVRRKEEEERKKEAEEAGRRKEEEERKKEAEKAVRRKEEEERKKEAEEAVRRKEEEERKKEAEKAVRRKEEEERKKEAEEAVRRKEEERKLEAQEAVRRKEEEERKLEAQEAVRRQEEEKRKEEAVEAARQREEAERRLEKEERIRRKKEKAAKKLVEEQVSATKTEISRLVNERKEEILNIIDAASAATTNVEQMTEILSHYIHETNLAIDEAQVHMNALNPNPPPSLVPTVRLDVAMFTSYFEILMDATDLLIELSSTSSQLVTTIRIIQNRILRILKFYEATENLYLNFTRSIGLSRPGIEESVLRAWDAVRTFQCNVNPVATIHDFENVGHKSFANQIKAVKAAMRKGAAVPEGSATSSESRPLTSGSFPSTSGFTPVTSGYRYTPVISGYGPMPLISAHGPMPLISAHGPIPLISGYGPTPLTSGYGYTPFTSGYGYTPTPMTSGYPYYGLIPSTSGFTASISTPSPSNNFPFESTVTSSFYPNPIPSPFPGHLMWSGARPGGNFNSLVDRLVVIPPAETASGRESCYSPVSPPGSPGPDPSTRNLGYTLQIDPSNSTLGFARPPQTVTTLSNPPDPFVPEPLAVRSRGASRARGRPRKARGSTHGRGSRRQPATAKSPSPPTLVPNVTSFSSPVGGRSSSLQSLVRSPNPPDLSPNGPVRFSPPQSLGYLSQAGTRHVPSTSNVTFSPRLVSSGNLVAPHSL